MSVKVSYQKMKNIVIIKLVLVWIAIKLKYRTYKFNKKLIFSRSKLRFIILIICQKLKLCIIKLGKTFVHNRIFKTFINSVNNYVDLKKINILNLYTLINNVQKVIKIRMVVFIL